MQEIDKKEVRSKSAANMCTIFWPCFVLDDTLCAQFWDGLLLVRISSFDSIGMPFGNFAAIDGMSSSSSVIVIAAASWIITTANSSKLIWIVLSAIAFFGFGRPVDVKPILQCVAECETCKLGIARDHMTDVHFPFI